MILQGILSKFMLAPMLILISFGYLCTDGRYSRHYMLDFHYYIQQCHDENFQNLCQHY